MLAFLSGSIVTRWSDERILSRSMGLPLKTCSHSDIGIPLGAPGARLINNLADLMSRLNFLIMSADLMQLGFRVASWIPRRPCHGISDCRSFLCFLSLSPSDSDEDEEYPGLVALSSCHCLSVATKCDNWSTPPTLGPSFALPLSRSPVPTASISVI